MMKQKLLFLTFLCVSFFTWAQPSQSYLISTSTQTNYLEIADGVSIGTKLYNKNFDAKSITSIDTGVSVKACDPQYTRGFSIGFPFYYGGDFF